MNDKIIVALDFPNSNAAKQCVADLGDSILWYKVGMELFYADGGETLRYLKSQKKKVFLDLKLQDIPNTVAHACSVLTRLGADIMNVHAVGGRKMMAEAVAAVHKTAEELNIASPKLIAVTILTSMDNEQYSELNYTNSVADQVLALAKLAKDAGMDGVVASPMEAATIRRVCGKDFLIVTPGIRPAGADVNDQSRVATPSAALLNGATHLVIGRPITQAKNRQDAVLAILKEIGD
ncbi:MAG: orotidine-5'-phosphate decarboxylase [Acidaminococcaceae bacterium]|nr:orotidine-5'-phosphate decarboxylase [Acidaminococcaceae bacterium]